MSEIGTPEVTTRETCAVYIDQPILSLWYGLTVCVYYLNLHTGDGRANWTELLRHEVAWFEKLPCCVYGCFRYSVHIDKARAVKAVSCYPWC
ncbi:hypothetical protein D3C85_1369070 [compost metagenome]